MIVFDFYEENQTQNGITIQDGCVNCDQDTLTNVLFRNYPELHIADRQLICCVFENCKKLHLTNCKIDESQVADMETLYAEQTQLWDCLFTHLRCRETFLQCKENSNFIMCDFVDVVLTGGAYLAEGVEDNWIDCSSYKKIQTDREDGVLFACEEILDANIVKRTQVCLVRPESC